MSTQRVRLQWHGEFQMWMPHRLPNTPCLSAWEAMAVGRVAYRFNVANGCHPPAGANKAYTDALAANIYEWMR